MPAWTVAAADSMHHVPDELTLREAAISYLCSWSVSALHLGSYRAAETVVVVGQGLVGASAALVADLMGARVLALDVAPDAIAFSSGLGLAAVAQPGTAAWRRTDRRLPRSQRARPDPRDDGFLARPAPGDPAGPQLDADRRDGHLSHAPAGRPRPRAVRAAEQLPEQVPLPAAADHRHGQRPGRRQRTEPQPRHALDELRLHPRTGRRAASCRSIG